MIPETSKMTTRGPLAVSAPRSDPGPSSSKFVTRSTRPPRPAIVVVPNPAAPGKTGSPMRAANASSPSSGVVHAKATAAKVSRSRFMHISYLARNAPFHAAGVPYLAILASSSFACALGYDRRSKQYWSTQFLLGAKIRIPQRRAHLRASTIIEGLVSTIIEGHTVA